MGPEYIKEIHDQNKRSRVVDMIKLSGKLKIKYIMI